MSHTLLDAGAGAARAAKTGTVVEAGEDPTTPIFITTPANSALKLKGLLCLELSSTAQAPVRPAQQYRHYRV